jgi:hypothetical protein
MREINSGDEAVSCYVSVERCQGVAEPERAMPALCEGIREYANAAGLPVPEAGDVSSISMLSDILKNWAKLLAPKPLVVLFDETDVLVDQTLISFLRQLRGGFATRGIGIFPTSIALVGMRDLKDYITGLKGGVPVNPGSPFNIKEDSASLSNFSRKDIERLFAQRTADTGQQITKEALDYAYDQSRGQPWIVNNLFKRATIQILGDDTTKTVTPEHIEEARKQMIAARETHLDALEQRLRDPRIRNIIQTIVTGEMNLSLSRTNPDVELAMDLGLVSWESKTGFTLANPIYEELLTRFLNAPYHDNLPPAMWKWEKADGTLDMDALLREFQDFWRNNSEIWEEQSDYHEAFPHLLLMAFLQRVTNGSGRIEREYAAGRGRMDLAVEYHGTWNIIEVKLLRRGGSFDTVKEEGLRQTALYRESFSRNKERGSPQCYLVIFDRRTDKPSWDERLKWLPPTNPVNITVVGC